VRRACARGRRVLRCCCLCCCRRWPTDAPEAVLGGRAMCAHKALLLLLCAGVAACCGYGMARADPQWVDQALGVLGSIKARAGRAPHLCSAFALAGQGHWSMARRAQRLKAHQYKGGL